MGVPRALKLRESVGLVLLEWLALGLRESVGLALLEIIAWEGVPRELLEAASLRVGVGVRRTEGDALGQGEALSKELVLALPLAVSE
jgi:hypothetical protein